MFPCFDPTQEQSRGATLKYLQITSFGNYATNKNKAKGLKKWEINNMLTLKVKTNELFRTEYDVIVPGVSEPKVFKHREPNEKDFIMLLAQSSNQFDLLNPSEKEIIVNKRKVTTFYGEGIAREIQKLEDAKIDYVIEWEEEKKKTSPTNVEIDYKSLGEVIIKGFEDGLKKGRGVSL